MDVEKVDTLINNVSLFNGLAREDVVKIFSKGTTMRMVKGEPVFYAGTQGDTMYAVLGGKLGVFDRDGKTLLAELRTGEMLGEMALVTNTPRSATVIALEDSLLFMLNHATFDRLMTKRVAIRMLFNIIGTLSQRLKAANERMQKS